MVNPTYDILRQKVRYLSSKPIPKVSLDTTDPENPISSIYYEMSPEYEIVELPPEEVVTNLLVARTLIKEEVVSIRDHHTLKGGYLADGKWFHSDVVSKLQQLALFTAGASIPNNLYWKTMDGSFVLMTQTLAQSIFLAATQQDIDTFAHAEYLKSLIDAAEHPYEVDIHVGWPTIFGEQ